MMKSKKTMKARNFLFSTFGCVLMTNAHAENFGGIEFPQGISSFADQVIQYNPLFSGGPAPTEIGSFEPNKALGTPDYIPGTGYVTLGRGGLIELLFTDNLLTNSGDNQLKDLHIFEVGPDVEDTFVAIRPTASTLPLLDPSKDSNKDGFFEIGKVFGSTSSIDIDVLFPGFSAGKLQFDAVQLIDDPNEGDRSGSTVGADIDAVGAISTVVISIPSVSGRWLLNANGSKYTWEITQTDENIQGTLQCINCNDVQTTTTGTIDENRKVIFRRDLYPNGDDNNDQVYYGFLFSGAEAGKDMAGLSGKPVQNIDEYSSGWYAVKTMDGSDSDDDGIPDAIEIIEGTNPNIKDNNVFSNNRLFVMQTYRDFLQREGDSAGIEFWTGVLNEAGDSGRINLITSFLDSPEFVDQIDTRFPNLTPAQTTVTALYVGMLARDPDADGLNYWATAFENGVPREQLILSFIGSSEYHDRFLQ